MLAPLLLALSPQVIEIQAPQSVYDLGAIPINSQPLVGPSASWWTRDSRIVEFDLPPSENPTPYAERFTVGFPAVPNYNQDAVVLFHGAHHHNNPQVLGVVAALNSAGYLVIVPQGGSYAHYGIQWSSDITEAVMSWVSERWPYERLFAYGFSMGGGSASSFLARHPGWFTGLLEHTGTVDLEAAWTLDLPTRQVLDVVYGHSPPSYDYTRMSTKNSPMGGNLGWVPSVAASWSNQDPLWSGQLWPESVAWAAQTASAVLGPYSAPVHRWDNVPYQDVLGWLGQPHGTPATEGPLVVDQGGTWGLLEVTQDNPGQFSTVTYQSQSDRVDLYDIDNVDMLEVDARDLGLDLQAPLIRLHCVMDPGEDGVVLRIAGFPWEPQVSAGPPGGGSASWSAGVLEVVQWDPNGGWLAWEIRP